MSVTTEAVEASEKRASAVEAGRPAAWPRLVGMCAVLVGLVFVQLPGSVATDTKLDLTLDPIGFLARTLHLWEPEGFFGQVQNQAYGYLFPTGPFFGLADLAHLSPWVTQRLWWSVLVCAAFLGVERLAAALGIGTPTTRIVAGVVYALSPRMLTVIGPSSVEVLPMALAPWVVLPLAIGSRRGSPRRAAAWSGLAVAAMGGVNAVATIAALVPAGLFLLTRASGPRSRRLAGWWVVAVGLATAWWVVPLLLLGRFSPPFLDWIESAPVTTSVTSLAASFRGASAWVAYLPSAAGPDLLAGWQLLTVPAVVLHTMLLAGLGAVGLAVPRLRERVWLLACLGAGLVLVTWGHVGAVDGGLAEAARESLDAALAPFRNTHKFDVAVRLPLVLGLAHGLPWLAAALRRPGDDGEPRLPVAVRASAVGLFAIVLLGSIAPLLTNNLVPRGSYTEVPQYWSEAAAWVDDHSQGRALVVPGASFGTFVWGRTRDDPLQGLSDTPWAVRDAVPLTPAGTIRALDAVQRRLAAGHGSPGIASFLARMGVDHLVVRNDLDPVAASAPRPVLVHQALRNSPGLTRVAAFGPEVGGGSTVEVAVDGGLSVAYPAVEIWAVEDAQPVVSVHPADSVLTVVGGPESLLDLSDRGLPPERPVVLAGDAADLGLLLSGSGPVLTDGMRRRETNYGRVDDQSSFTLAESEQLRRDAASRDYLPFDGWEVSARWLGVESVVASSSAGDATAPGGAQTAFQPAAAMDRDPATAWQSDGASGAEGEWLEVRFRSPLDPGGAQITVGEGAGPATSRVVVTTDQGSVDQPVTPGRPQNLLVAPGPTTYLRVTASATGGTKSGPGGAFAVRELAIPNVVVGHPLETPGVGTAAYLTVADGARSACVGGAGSWVCAPDLSRDGEETAGIDRVIRMDPDHTYRVHATVMPRPGPALDALLDGRYWGVRVAATSSSVAAPQGRPQVVVDGSMGTSWVAERGDPLPTLRVRLAEDRRVTGARLGVAPGLAASMPVSVEVAGRDETVAGDLDASGVLRFPAMRTDTLDIRFVGVSAVQSHDPRTGFTTTLPVGVSELEIRGAEDLFTTAPASDPVVVPCSVGPSVWVGSRQLRLSVTTTVAELLGGAPLLATVCGDDADVEVPGRVRVQVPSTDAWLARSVDVIPVDGAGVDLSVPAPNSSTGVEVAVWEPASRVVEVGSRSEPSLLVVRENRNAGWVATWEGTTLESVVIDGWQQGWVLPAGGAGTVELVYQPDGTYRWGLAAGGAGLVVLLLLSLLRGRTSWPGAGPAAIRPVLVTAAGALVLWLLADWWGVAAGAVAGIGVRALPARHRLPAVACGVGAAVAIGAVLLARNPWGEPGYAGNAAAPQATVVAALALLLAGLVADSRWGHGDPAAQPHDGTFEDDPAEGGERDRAEDGLDEHRPESSSEDGSVADSEDG